MEVFAAVCVIGLLILALSFVFDIGEGLDMDWLDDGLSWFSIKVLAASMVGFGAFGVIATAIGLPGFIAWIIAGIGFFAVGFSVYKLIIKPLSRMESNTLISRDSYMNRTATVVLAILPDRPGRVRFKDDQGALVEEIAYATESHVIPAGQQVAIYEVHPHHVSVVPISV